eukprot:CAMPEP_0185756392 /NCGR_PEP_ID=MMETSP1174-20130828/14823_1 /TAXON_ID=35687 /ORGANISM="Dictyocha speculum, Strain CCMP1381" /LENGTH=534 /DNA_ID=CAMNT_0028435335 /DNA_START=224 /DNA_END=1831 /DNA_ORIENTATION=+
MEEFCGGFQAFVERIEPAVTPHGICKIIPPKGWWKRLDYRSHIEKSRFDNVITTPIRQCVAGARGVYWLTLLETPAKSLKDFEQMAEASAKRNLPPNLSIEQRVRRFWKTLSTTMEPPLYGADIPGSLFDGEAAATGWNVDNLDTVLQRTIHPPVGGVTNAMLYVGTWRAMFAYHVEDMNLYSINYLHMGAPKSWYSVRPAHARRFESMAQALQPEAAAACSEFLRHKTFMFSPARLKESGINFDTVFHEPGEFVLTFPMSYHAGFNHGFNIAESTNFATRSWARGPGSQARVCRCSPDSVKIDVLQFFRAETLDEEIPRLHSNLQRDSMNSKKRLDGRDQNTPLRRGKGSFEAGAKRRRLPELRIGDRVLVRWKDRRWYPACVHSLDLDGRHADVIYDTGEREANMTARVERRLISLELVNISKSLLLAQSSTESRNEPEKESNCIDSGVTPGRQSNVLQCKDPVFVRWSDGEWYEARVYALNEDGYVDVLYDTGEVETHVERACVSRNPPQSTFTRSPPRLVVSRHGGRKTS